MDLWINHGAAEARTGEKWYLPLASAKNLMKQTEGLTDRRPLALLLLVFLRSVGSVVSLPSGAVQLVASLGRFHWPDALLDDTSVLQADDAVAVGGDRFVMGYHNDRQSLLAIEFHQQT